MKFMQKRNLPSKAVAKFSLPVLGFSFVFACSTFLSGSAFSQNNDPSSLPDETPLEEAFEFDDGADFEQSAEELEDSFRKEAFQQALRQLLPLSPNEIRTLLEHYDRTEESTQVPVHPYPRPELIVQNVSLDPGVIPLSIKTAHGYVTTLSILDSSGEPWPIEDISWVGDFLIHEQSAQEHTHFLRITPESKFAHGNISMRLAGLKAPVIMTLETDRDLVHYRFDAVIPKRGPGARTPLIDPGVTLTSGDPDMSVALGGVVPHDADILNVSGVDGRTSAYIYNGLTYVRTPHTLLSPAWDSSVTSADGTKIYALEETPVVLLSDKGRMVRAYLNVREEVLDE